MNIQCCNPECQAPFKHREGRLMRFSRTVENDGPSETRHVIQHFWLCGKCSPLYVCEYESGSAVKIKSRDRQSSEENLSRAASVS
jgi:hypothetical protein